jgi:pantoate--beta-alanine ligase
MTQLITELGEWLLLRRRLRAAGQSIGFVPTMGALHAGHFSLVETAHAQNQVTLVSIFVNPTQFNDRSDYAKYPRMLEQDVELLAQRGVDFVLAPAFEALYPDGYRYKVSESEESKLLCGKDRPGHFDGVLTVVMKLLNLVAPQRAYFGEKDFQQLQLIRGMVEAFFLDVEIVACPTIREADGLALSSRNLRLNETERRLAASFPQILRQAATEAEARAQLAAAGFRVIYVERYKERRCGAVQLGEVRLIDNMPLP